MRRIFGLHLGSKRGMDRSASAGWATARSAVPTRKSARASRRSALCRRANVERIEVGPKGAVLAFRDNIFSNPEGLIAYIAKHPEGARVRPDVKVVFFDERGTPPARLKGAAGILRTLVAIAEKGAKAA
jgi:hypothetical protein